MKAMIIEAHTKYPTPQGMGSIVWRVQKEHPFYSDRTIIRIYDMGDSIRVFTMPKQGSELEQELIKSMGGLFGHIYTVPSSDVIFMESIASMMSKDGPSDWHELLRVAEETQTEIEDGDPGDDPLDPDDPEDPEEEEEVPQPPVPHVFSPPQPIPMPGPLPQTPSNGQTTG